MQIFLRFLSDPGFQIGIGKEEGVHRTTICKTISHVLPKIVEKAGIWIKFPAESSTDQAINEWAQVYRFPCAFGAIDCTHVPIIKPSLHVDAQRPGSVHDSRILKRSNIFGKMRRRQQNGLILGDEGYGITPWLLTPYRNPTTPQEIAYNTLHKRERVIIERCFGQLKRRFPVLQHQIRLNIDKIPSVIVSAVVLHNVAKYLNDQLPNDEEEVAAEDHDGEEVVEDNDELNNDRQRGQQRREEITIIFPFPFEPLLVPTVPTIPVVGALYWTN
ncbi:DDE superfamily endonuclease [Popillia japonica]|uniref:DDE superfamily endonuclease n=1 Tax=Popillia japonica TaxID=7064 RepID=A0AAW1LA88_POPJA